MTELAYPFAEKAIRALKAGDAVSITGRIYTGRDKFHKFFADGGKLPVDFKDGALYHCGPVVVRNGREGSPEPSDGARSCFRVVAAGPTTSVRENPYEPDFIAKSGVRIVRRGLQHGQAVAFRRIVEEHLAAEELAPVGEALDRSRELDFGVQEGQELVQRVHVVVGRGADHSVRRLEENPVEAVVEVVSDRRRDDASDGHALGDEFARGDVPRRDERGRKKRGEKKRKHAPIIPDFNVLRQCRYPLG